MGAFYDPCAAGDKHMSSNTTENVDMRKQYTETKAQVESELRAITKFHEPNRSHLWFFQKFNTQSPSDFFSKAQRRLSDVAPDIATLYSLNRNKKDLETRIDDHLVKRKALLDDLLVVIQNIRELQETLLADNVEKMTAQEKLEKLKTSINDLKEKHKGAIQHSKCLHRLLVGVTVFGIIAMIVIPVSLISVSGPAFALSFFIGMGAYFTANIPLIYMAENYDSDNHDRLFIELTADKCDSIEKDYAPALTVNI